MADARTTLATRTPLEPTFVQRVSGALRYALTGKAPDWFGPGVPFPPVAPAEEPKGRAFDYPWSANIAYRPRSEAGETAIDFVTLRRMAEPTQGGYDLIRLAIETRKDQMSGQQWTIQPRGESGNEKRAADLAEQLQEPDLEHDYATWQRMLLEDLFVLDAPTLYKRQVGAGRYVPEVVDGATIKRLISEDGRTPLPPDPAYQQIVKGLPAFDYTLDELVYFPRNPRPNRIYGFSPVEQVILTVQTALNRQLSQLLHFTAGNIPAALISVPEAWNPDQIKQFQVWFDAYLAGNLEAKSGAIFIPGGSKPTITKDSPVKDEFDEWLARIVCYAFSISPSALVRQVNRASGETMKEAAQEEGLEPLKLYWRTLMNRVLARVYGAPDMEFVYEEEEITDAATKAKVFNLALAGKAWMTQDEAREGYGKPPLTDEQKEELGVGAPPMLPPGIAAGAGGPGEKGIGNDEKVSPKEDDAGAEKVAQAVVAELKRQRSFVAKSMPRKEKTS